ncbi:helicase C-terminal domain-containing protein [Lactobacillus sp. PV034]|uniref:helicase C-terminal domain-containing protein n=1 Tax=Lactobacillus sp. PV034 TaxID=2594495 RepID=UPI00223EEE27|nr:helicase C-terminal domain-containing protein [Lactobacillus sp. PV034]QNQ80407.1 DEAD/DEAH box helicase [Lactobacillus sp. PV034]
MEQAFKNDTFAVVDLETTGTQREQGDRIIQFGCAIIKKRKVVKTYSFLINPHHEIPQSVENLTGIKNEDVKDAYDFSFYAKKIKQILDNTIFIAHNVNFDLPFLNYELVNAGLEPLRGKAIDTVELAQIAFPTYPSYKLKDLTARLKIKHLNPHRADSDALVTAKLLLKIIKRLEQLPTATLNLLTTLSKGLLRDTYYIFFEISQMARQTKRPISKDLIQVRNLILKKQKLPEPNMRANEDKFPVSDKEKKELFKGKIRYRKGQTALINRLHEFIEHDQQENLIVEAPNGSGKTFSYLMAYAYELYSGRKLVIATPTKVLQEQIFRQEIPQLIDITGLDLFAQEVKSSSHYLDLDGFYNSLYQRNYDQQTLVWQMEILVWLTQTTTGDLDELQLTNYNNPFFSQIQHPGDARLGTYFSEVDFWNLARERQEQADILITNHAYLANHFTDSIWGQNPYLVVDEAHRFVDNVTSSRSDGLQFESFWGNASHLRNLLLFGPNSVKEKFGNQQEFGLILDQLEVDIANLIHAINRTQEYFYQFLNQATSRVEKRQNRVDFGFQGQDLFPNPDKTKQLLNQIQTSIEKVRQETNQVLFLLYQQQEHLISSNDVLVQDIQEALDQLDFYAEQTYLLLDQLNDKKSLAEKGFILQVTDVNDPLSTNIVWMMLDPSNELKQLYHFFSKRLFISATSMNNNSFEFMEKNLSLAPEDTLSYQAKASFNVEKHLSFWALSDPNVNFDPNSTEYAHFIAEFLKEAISHQSHVLVLFTNLDTIKNVFTEIINDPNLKDYEILAQGITGSNQRIAKRFGIAEKAILLGANSFWEGIDFKNKGVDLAIAVKLPFESPDNPEVKLREERLKKQSNNMSIFEEDTLPRALIRFKQGAGRLIRNERDHGIFVILDQRIWHKNYGQQFLNALPVGAKKVTYKQLISLLKEDHNE